VPTFDNGIIIADAGIISLQEYIDFTGDTGVNYIKMPDNLADAFSIQEATNKYITFCTTDGAERVNVIKQMALTVKLDVSEGGTGLATLTLHGVVYGNAAADVGITAEGATGQYLKGTTGNAPSWDTLNQAAVAGLTTADGPTFDHIHLTDRIYVDHIYEATSSHDIALATSINMSTRDIKEIRKLSFNAGATKTIASGAITVTGSVHLVATEGGAASDDLDTISGGSVLYNDILILRAADSTKDVVVKHNTGNIWLAGGVDFTLDHTADIIVLMWVSVGGPTEKWVEICRSSNA
jgi:hypothetical protein